MTLRTIFIALIFCAAIVWTAVAAPIPMIGRPAPAVVLPSQDGSVVDLKSFRGKWVVLYFYPKDMTPGCTIEAHNFQQNLTRFERENAVIVGVSVDTTASHQEFCTKESLSFKLLSDTDRKVVDRYGSLGQYGAAMRNTFLIDPSGKLVQVWKAVNPSNHSEEVLTAIEERQKLSR